LEVVDVEAKSEVGKVNWPLWIAFIILLELIVNPIIGILHMSGVACIYGLGTICIPFAMPVLAMMLPLIASLTGKFRKSETTLAMLYLIGLITSMSMAESHTWLAMPSGRAQKIWFSSD
jgi:hypothetical protein